MCAHPHVPGVKRSPVLCRHPSPASCRGSRTAPVLRQLSRVAPVPCPAQQTPEASGHHLLPCVLCCRRGLIMGVWNSHTSVGNILGSLIAGYWVSTCWGLSFIVPGAIVAAMGIVCFLFLIERKYPCRRVDHPEGFGHEGLRAGCGSVLCSVGLPRLPPHQVDSSFGCSLPR